MARSNKIVWIHGTSAHTDSAVLDVYICPRRVEEYGVHFAALAGFFKTSMDGSKVRRAMESER